MVILKIKPKPIILAFLLLAGTNVFGQNFLKANRYNRFQYHKYHWQVLVTPKYKLYFPKGYDSLAAFASYHLPAIMLKTENKMGEPLTGLINIIIYPSLVQFYESNVGLHKKGMQHFPTINLKGYRITIAFAGSHQQFLQQLKEAWVRITWQSAFRYKIKAPLSKQRKLIPTWFKEGCIRYFAEGWPLKGENALYLIYKKEKFKNENEVIRTNPSLAGQAFCYFLSDKYRPDACKQIFFQLKSGKSLAEAVHLITKEFLPNLKWKCFRFYKKRMPPQDTLLDYGIKKEGKYNQKENSSALLSPSGEYSARIRTQKGKRYVFVQAKNQKSVKILSYHLPPWLKNHKKNHYPLLQWKNNHILLAAWPKKGKIRVQRFTIRGKPLSYNTLTALDGLISFKIWDKNLWLLDAFRQGQSDIVLYNPWHLKYQPITTDLGDNLGLSVMKNKGQTNIVYRSGLPTDSLRLYDSLTKPYGIYLVNLSTEQLNKIPDTTTPEQLILKDSDYVHWHHPVLSDNHKITVTGATNGRVYRGTFSLDQTLPISFKMSNVSSATPSPWLKDYLKRQKNRDSLAKLKRKLKKRDNMLMGKILHPADSSISEKMSKDSLTKALFYSPNKVKPYFLQLYSSYFTAGINNDYFFNRYQPFQSYLGTFKLPEVGAIFEGGFSDLFDNQNFNIGYRMPTGTKGSDFFFRYENVVKNLDWHFLFFRSVQSLKPNPLRNWKDAQGRRYPAAAKVKTQYYEIGIHLPLTYDLSFNLQTALRGDRTVFLATDKYSLYFKDLKKWWDISTLSFNWKNTQHLPILFLKKGWVLKFTLDGMAGMQNPGNILYGVQLKGAYHQPIFKGINLVGRVQVGNSGGTQHVLYNFGGLDNEITTWTDSAVQFLQNAPYAFQAMVTPMRGYPQNSLYGSRYGLFNVAVYVPVFQKLIPLQTSFTSLNQLQLCFFSDLGVAGGPAATLKERQTEKLFSFGFGARTILAGYPIRFDLAWPGNFKDSPLWYLSLSF